MGVSNGVITAPINASDPYVCMGIGKYNGWYDVGYACRNDHKKINQWSFWKPIEFQKPSELSEADYFSKDDGFTISNYNFPSKIIRALAAGKGWVYNAPTTWFRLTDFNKYDHYQEPWFTLAVDGKNYGASGDTIRFTMPMDLAWLISNFSSFEDVASVTQGGVVDIGFIVSSRWTADAGLTSTYYYKISDYLDFNDPEKMLRITIPSSTSAIPDGNYYVVPVITTFTEPNPDSFFFIAENSGAGNSGTWYTIPANPVQISIDRDRPQFNPLDFFYIEYTNITYDEGRDTDIWKTITFTAKAGMNDQYTSTAGKLVIEWNVPNVYPGTGSSTITKTIGSVTGNSIGKGQSVTKAVNSGKMYFLSDKEEGNVYMLVNVSFTLGSRTYRKTIEQYMP